MRHDSIDQAVNGRVQERTGLEYQRNAQGLAEAVEQQQAASRAAVHWREVLDKTEDSEYGKFGWVIDPEGNKVELWEPPAGQ